MTTNEVAIQEKVEQDWIIAHDQGKWLIGRPTWTLGSGAPPLLGGTPTKCELQPCFELHMQTIPVDGRGNPTQGPPAGFKINYVAQPIMLITSLDSWTLSPYANSWPVKGQSVESILRSAVQQAEDQVASMRAQQAGISLARELPQQLGNLGGNRHERRVNGKVRA